MIAIYYKYYKQSINLKSNSWTAPKKSTDNKNWVLLKKGAVRVYKKIPFAINKIERWYKKHGYRVFRQEKLSQGYKVIQLMISRSES